MNLQGQVPIIGGSGQPFVMQSQVIIKPELKDKLEQWQNETGIHMITLGNIMLALGLAQLSIILDYDESRKELTEEALKRQNENGASPE